MLRALFLIALAVMPGGCVRSSSTAIGEATFGPRPNDYDITVFVPTDAPVAVHKAAPGGKPVSEVPANAQVIGRIDTAGAPAASWGSMISEAKSRARKLGGDGIVIGQWDRPVTGVTTQGSTYGGSYTAQSYMARGKLLMLTVVRYRD